MHFMIRNIDEQILMLIISLHLSMIFFLFTDPAAGGSDDYVRGEVGVKYAYTIELPPHHEGSSNGFLVPEQERGFV